MISTSCTCPQEVRAQNHRIRNTGWWQDPAYRARTEQFLKDNPVCEYCDRKATVVHHDEDWMYASQEAYFDPANFTPACARCHREYRQGKVICPECRQHYIVRDGPHDRCRWCRGIKNPGVVPKRKRISRHPCGNRIGQQRCQRGGRLYVCGYSSKGARACEHFNERKTEATD